MNRMDFGLAVALTTMAFLAVCLPAEARGKTTEAWDQPAFSVDADTWRSAVANRPEPKQGKFVEYLLDEMTVTFHDANRVEKVHRQVFRIVTQQGIQENGRIEESWSPWYQARPEVRARVIPPDGGEVLLDPETLGDAPLADRDQDIYTDRRVVRGPLPALAVGAIVEVEVRYVDTAAFFDGGTVGRFYFGLGVPVERTRLTLDAPSSVPLRFETPGLRIRPVRRKSGGRVELLFEGGPYPAREFREYLAPPDPSHWPRIAWSTGSSWEDVSRVYHSTVEAQLAGEDLASEVDEAMGGRSLSRKEKIARLLQYLHGRVRYTGVEFGEAAIVPRRPSEALGRGYGDCKDKSVLLVGLLRAAGIEAEVALLSTGSGEDISEDLAGFGDFDHAIVHIPGDDAIWIDPTVEFARADDLPAMDRGRLALLVRGSKGRLLRTPPNRADQNRYREVREVFLAKRGSGRIVETTTASGMVERFFRNHWSSSDPKQLEADTKNGLREFYSAKSVPRIERTDPKDLETPLRSVVELGEASAAVTERSDAAVRVDPGVLFGRLPWFLGPSDGSAPRKMPLALQEPYIAEIEYRIEIPPGYEAVSIPEEIDLEFGPARLSRSMHPKGGTLTARFRFHTGDGVWSAADVEAFREARARPEWNEFTLLAFRNRAVALLEEGRVREALDECRRLVRLYPEEAGHQAELARALLAAGFGEPAEEAARRAIELEASADTWGTLGWILQHDSLGRRFGYGSDYEGAIDAFREAIRRDPKDFVVRADLAILLEHDPVGTRYFRPGGLDDAIAEYRKIQEELEERSLDENLMVALLRAGRFKEALQVATESAASPLRNSVLIAAIAATDSVDAAIARSATLGGSSERRVVLEAAGANLLAIRDYSKAADLLSAAVAGSADPVSLQARAAALRSVRRHDDMRVRRPDSDPVSVVHRAFLAMFVDRSPEAMIDLFAASVREREKDSEDGVQTVLDSLAKRLPGDLSPEALVDITVSTMRSSVDEATWGGFRIRVSIAGPTGKREDLWFAVREKRRLVLVSLGESANLMEQLGSRALYELDEGRNEAAAGWLGWASDSMRKPSGPFDGPAFMHLWRKDDAKAPERIRVAAASLAGQERPNKELRRILEKARKREVDASRILQIDRALSAHYVEAGLHEDLLAMAERHEGQPDSGEFVYMLRAAAYQEAGRYGELRRLCEERMKEFPDDAAPVELLARVLAKQGAFAEARELRLKLVESGRASSATLNNLAWESLFEERNIASAVEFAERANAMTQYGRPATLHTLATAYGEIGKVQQARELLLRAIELRGARQPTTHDWYVLGRLAEHYDLRDVALSSYEKVKPDEQAGASSTHHLARRRIEILRRNDADSPGKTSGKSP